MQHDDLDLPPFTAFMSEHRKGAFNAEATAQMAEVARRVRETGQPGTVTLKLTIAPLEKGKPNDSVIVKDEVVGKPPRDDHAALWFVGDSGELSRTHADQMSVFDGLENQE